MEYTIKRIQIQTIHSVEGKSTAVTINTAGRTVIYAYAVDGREMNQI